MARRKWIRLPGGRLKRWKKSLSERRPGTGTARWGSEVPPVGTGGCLTIASARSYGGRSTATGRRVGRTYIHELRCGIGDSTRASRVGPTESHFLTRV